MEKEEKVNKIKFDLRSLTIDKSDSKEDYILYNFEKLDSDLSKFILEKFGADLLDKKHIKLSLTRLHKIHEKNYEIFGKELFKKIYTDIPKHINVAYKGREDDIKKSLTKIYQTKKNEFIFISNIRKPGGDGKLNIAIVLSSNSEFMYIKTFYYIYRINKKENTFKRKYKKINKKAIKKV